MDSRGYRFIFSFSSETEAPDDFAESLTKLPFEEGIFLPQEDTAWWTLTPRFPARLLLLASNSLVVLPHPSSSEDPARVSLADLAQLEVGTSFLSGWIKLTTSQTTIHLPYNTRASGKLDRFLSLVRQNWLGCPPALAVPLKSLGPGLDIKFRNLLADALDPNEALLFRFFYPPESFTKGPLFWRKEKWLPGNLLALTTAGRLLWINDNHRGYRGKYAGVTLSAPCSRLRRCLCKQSASTQTLQMQFSTGPAWQFSCRETARELPACAESLSSLVAAKIDSPQTSQATPQLVPRERFPKDKEHP